MNGMMNKMNKRVLFIYNPHAGKGNIKSKLSDILEIFSNADYEITVQPTKYKRHAKELVSEKGTEYDLIVCSGGDGTLNEVTDGLMLLENRPHVGYIPTGTTNDFASGLNISKNMIKAAHTTVEGEDFPYDIGSLNDDFFTYSAAFGAFTDVSYGTPQATKNVLGRLAYILEGVKRIPSIKSYHLVVEHDGETIEDDFIFGMITNSTSIGGFKGLSGKKVILDDGLFEVALIKMPQNPLDLQLIISSLVLRDPNAKYIYSFHSNEIKITSKEDLPWALDGEFGGEFKEMTIRNHKQAVTFRRDKKVPTIK
ncbi:diacylglycerol/lipid kinase family protein [Anaeromicropila herbilytica]|uniref:Diacylglycerol kinase n=1 Tax=Anaeromicropila herbilytica TaxID=2785025 RepID=A0A7R7IDW8_9FIRM|nr:YegS/Rv2252/BmrU family lipid kinase [Anaeromicropila herbilytica]BCN32148.1 diacylglycerol kinase [Anaeromicropila herbilytica]